MEEHSQGWKGDDNVLPRTEASKKLKSHRHDEENQATTYEGRPEKPRAHSLNSEEESGDFKGCNKGDN